MVSTQDDDSVIQHDTNTTSTPNRFGLETWEVSDVENDDLYDAYRPSHGRSRLARGYGLPAISHEEPPYNSQERTRQSSSQIVGATLHRSRILTAYECSSRLEQLAVCICTLNA